MARRWLLGLAWVLACAALPGLVFAQRPEPFPRPADPGRPPAETPEPRRPPPERDARERDAPERDTEPDTERDALIPEDEPLADREVIPPSAPVREDRVPLTRQRAPAAGTETATQDGLFPREPTPSEATLGFPLFAEAQFIRSYNAGRGQRYYLFGTTSSFEEVVSFYRDRLRDRGRTIFDEPPVHRFEEGRFDQNRMAFPPSVTVSDFTWGNAAGYLDPQPNGEPRRHPTVIQIVPGPRVAER